MKRSIKFVPKKNDESLEENRRVVVTIPAEEPEEEDDLIPVRGTSSDCRPPTPPISPIKRSMVVAPNTTGKGSKHGGSLGWHLLFGGGHAHAGKMQGGAIGRFLDAKMNTVDGAFQFLRVPGISVVLSATAGVCLTPLTIDPDSNVTGVPFWVDIADMFEEYRLIGASLRTGSIKAGSTNTGEGYNAIYIDEFNPTTNPVAADAYAHSCVFTSNANQSPSGGKFTTKMAWKASDFPDAEWLSTTSTSPSASFKVVISPLTTGSNSGTTSEVLLAQIFYDFACRQFRS